MNRQTFIFASELFILKLIIYGICMNFSYFLISQFIDIFSNISMAIRNIGEILF